MAQGLEDWISSTRDEQAEVLRRWQPIQMELGPSSLKAEIETQVQNLGGHRAKKKTQGAGNKERERERLTQIQHPAVSSAEKPGLPDPVTDNAGSDMAIQQTVAATSTGDLKED